MTQEGGVVGTVQFMSPDQLEGKEVEERSDIFSAHPRRETPPWQPGAPVSGG